MKPIPTLKRALHARSTKGTTLIQQFKDVLRLKLGRGRLGLSEYYAYGLYDRQTFPADKQATFVGWAGEVPLNDYFNHPEWAAFSIDKIAFYGLCLASDIATPDIACVYSPRGRRLTSAASCTTPESLAEFLRDYRQYPLFAKPSHGNFGRGSRYLDSYDASDDSIVGLDGEKTLLQSFIDGLETELSRGYLFQTVFHPPLTVETVCGKRSTTVRVSMAVLEDGAIPVSAVWKLPTGTNIIDNFEHGRTGNLIASVDVATGIISRAMGGRAKGRPEEVSHHPETGELITGFQLPYWETCVALCADAANQLPGYRLLHFDVALGREEPLLLEVNHRGNIDLHQHASGRGFLSQAVERAFQDQERRNSHIARIIAQNDAQSKSA